MSLVAASLCNGKRRTRSFPQHSSSAIYWETTATGQIQLLTIIVTGAVVQRSNHPCDLVATGRIKLSCTCKALHFPIPLCSCDYYRAVPSVTTATNFLLEMEDSYGGFSSSHTFTFTRMLILNLSLRVTLKSQSVTQAFSSVSSALHNSSIGPPLVSSPVATRMTRPRGAISPAAYVVPLSISGIIVLAAITFGVYQRKKLKSEHSLQSQEFKMFKLQFTDNLGRLRGLSMWAAHLATGRHRGQTVANERAKVDDYFTHIYVPQFPSEKRAPKRTKVAQRGSSSLGSEPTVYSHTPNAQPVHVHGGRQHLNIVPEEDEAVNAEANHDIVSRYLHPSPMPPAPKPAHIRATSRDGRRRED